MAAEGEDLTEGDLNRITVENICKPLQISDADLRKIKDIMLNEINMGLCKYTHEKADVKCLPTYVHELPSGCERGKFLALDLGGTNFRVLVIQLEGDEESTIDSQIYEIPKNLMVGLGSHLFDHIAECLGHFLHSRNLEKENLDMGFTFSFPTKQVGLQKGILLKWTKGFACPDVVGRDVGAMLDEAILRKEGLSIGVVAILNDTTGTLMSCAYKNKSTKIGLIIGTGTNACYLEKVKHIQTINSTFSTPPTMIINTEWGALGENGSIDFIRTTFDQELDENSLNVGLNKYEKMISGMYLGEVARLAIVACIEAGALFEGNVSDQLRQRNSFKTKYLSQIESETPGTYVIMRQILETLGCRRVRKEDCENIRYICEQVTTRSSNLVAAGLACLIDRIGDPFLVVAIDGTLYRLHPHYSERLKRKTRQLTQPEHKFDLMLSEDGSGRGAALVAAVLAQKAKSNSKV